MSCAIDVLIVDYRIEGFRRYAIGICSELHKIDPNLRIGACYMEKKTPTLIDGFSEVFCAEDYALSAKRILEVFKPRAILTFAHRFFDYMFTIEAHRMGILVFNFQHGLYMDSTVISELSSKSIKQVILKKQEKLRIYLRCSYNMNEMRIIPSLYFFLLFLKHRSLYRVVNYYFGSVCNADYSYIYGEYWEQYYKKQYLERNTQFVIVGYPELEGDRKSLEKNIFDDPSLPTICYLAQTSVEDGLLPLNTMQAFLKELENCLLKYNLILKLHPRSNRQIYSSILDDKNHGRVRVWDYPEFPDADMYIGHESTVVARAMYITNKTMIVRLAPERVSPFEQYACFSTNSMEYLSKSIKEMEFNDDAIINPSFKEYVYYNSTGSLLQTAIDMIDRLSLHT